MAPPIQSDPQLLGSAVSSFKDLIARLLAPLATLFFALSAIPDPGQLTIQQLGAPIDPCAAISGKKWVAPSDVRACFTSFKVDPVEQANVSADYDLPCRPLSRHLLTSFPITRLCPLALGSLTSIHPPITRSWPPNRFPLTFTRISSATWSESMGPITRTTSSSTLMFHALSRG